MQNPSHTNLANLANLDRSSRLQPLMILLVILLCGAVIAGLQIPQLQQLQSKSQTASIETIRRDLEAEKLRLTLLQKLPTLGFDNLIADWTFLSFLQYFGDQPARQKTDYSLSPEFFEVVLRRDPYFMQAYTFLSTSSSLYAGLPERSTQLMQSSLKSLKPNVPPNSYTVWRQLGIDQLLFLGDAPAARNSFQTAAEWAAQSSDPDSQASAQISQRTADFLADNPDSTAAQITAWVMVLGNAPDDRTRQMAVQRIESLGGRLTRQPNGSYSIDFPSSK